MLGQALRKWKNPTLMLNTILTLSKRGKPFKPRDVFFALGRTFTNNQGNSIIFMKAYAAVNRLSLRFFQFFQLKDVLRSPAMDKACFQAFQPFKLDCAIRQMNLHGAASQDDKRANAPKTLPCTVNTGASPQIQRRVVILQPVDIASYQLPSLTLCVPKTIERKIHNLAKTRPFRLSQQVDLSARRFC